MASRIITKIKFIGIFRFIHLFKTVRYTYGLIAQAMIPNALNEYGYKVIRFTNDEVKNHLELVLEAIKQEFNN